MYSDCHLHTEFSGDSSTPVREQIETAITRGMTELCITDHHDYDSDFSEIDFTLDVENYLAALLKYREEYRDRIRLLIGIEFGLQPHLLAYEQEFFARYDFDFVIGSTHYIDGTDPYYPQFFKGRTEDQAYSRYFEVLADNVRRFQCYDSAGHLDYVLRYGPTKNKNFSYSRYADYLDDALKTLIARGKGLECNTAGLRQGLGQPNPHLDIIRRYRELGGEIITIGSDAHISRDIGSHFDEIGAWLTTCGFTYYAVYQNRKPVFHKL